ncbi:hypothetical protein D9757_000941 [Collybiopsis confluens]|uniref:F-box domain-containing protein n=1 Tax=Collybiopsis confluens TaxID=2823264 RepID=A0A8H5MGA9_9AGAR|nr:hypothetical protein D9757_000941 [Collybiopsis confluens]
MPPAPPASFDAIPQEILSEIAIYLATDTFLGPPSAILPLISTNRWLYSCLSFHSNPYVYAKIYESKFDLSPAFRRLGITSFATTTLARELKRRCILLDRIRHRQLSSRGHGANGNVDDDEELGELLAQIYLMVVENDGNNERQLREYGQIEEWLMEYWLDEHGASGSLQDMQKGIWPAHNETNCLAMWLYWFLLRPEKYAREATFTRRALDILKVYALGAHWYPLVTPLWTEFISPSSTDGAPLLMYNSKLSIKAPALAVPAILAFISLLSHLVERTDFSTPVVPSHASPPRKALLESIGNEWEYEWGRSTSLGTQKLPANNILSDAFRPGSAEGIWEGIFTYTEFTSYAALLSGAPPQFLQNVLVAQHKQTWKLREHHLLSPSFSSSDFCPLEEHGDGKNVDYPEPISPGNALHAYFPIGTHIEENVQGITVIEPGSGKKPLFYERCGSHQGKVKHVEAKEVVTAKRRVLDIVITGEGHSSWGEFRLIGRVRPRDGFISLSKDYINGDRGKWLYRGYLVGNLNPNLAGRWRDTLSPATVPGYEGCFTMSRRR